MFTFYPAMVPLLLMLGPFTHGCCLYPAPLRLCALWLVVLPLYLGLATETFLKFSHQFVYFDSICPGFVAVIMYEHVLQTNHASEPEHRLHQVSAKQQQRSQIKVQGSCQQASTWGLAGKQVLVMMLTEHTYDSHSMPCHIEKWQAPQTTLVSTITVVVTQI